MRFFYPISQKLNPRNSSVIHASCNNRIVTNKISGFTLVELLVGLLLSLTIGSLALTFMVSSTQSFKVQSNDSVSNENARFVLELLSQNIRLGGLNPDNDFTFNLDVIYNGNLCPNTEAGISDGDDQACTVDNLANQSDRFAIDFVTTEDITGCNGQAITVPTGSSIRVAYVFWVADLDDTPDGIRSLYCQPINLTTELPIGTALPLVDGVDRLQVQYGVDTLDASGNSDGFVDRYQSYTNLVATSPTNPTLVTRQVKTVRFAILVNSGLADTESNSEVAENKTYQLLDGPAVTINNDQILRQVYSSTVMLPNSL